MVAPNKSIRIDGIKWIIWTDVNNNRQVQPICPTHHLRLYPIPYIYSNKWGEEATKLKCEDCNNYYDLPRSFRSEKLYVINRLDAKVFEGMEVINLDDEATPIAKKKIESKDNKYFLTAQMMDSKRGVQVVIYAGEKGKAEKTQIFADPKNKRLSFDQKDLKPTDVFLKIEGTFDDGSSHIIEKNGLGT